MQFLSSEKSQTIMELNFRILIPEGHDVKMRKMVVMIEDPHMVELLHENWNFILMEILS